MSIKTAVKEHISYSPLKEHLKKHGSFFLNETVSQQPICSDCTAVYQDGWDMRNFSEEDLNNCVELYKDVFSADPWNDQWIESSVVRDYLNELINNPVFRGYVIYKNSEMIAACLGHSRSWWSGKEFFIDEFFVSAKFQGKGIGTMLMNFVENHPDMINCNIFHLLTDKDVPAKNFYVKNGFKTRDNRITMVKKFF